MTNLRSLPDVFRTAMKLAAACAFAASIATGAAGQTNTFQPTGNAGAGTTTPARKLEILDSGNPQLRLTHTDGSVYTDFQTIWSGQLLISPTGSDVSVLKPVSVAADSDAFRFFTNANTDLRWSVNTDASGLFHIVQKGDGWAIQGARLSINRSGNVGVGTTAPEAKLNVLGDFLLGGVTDTAVSNYNLSVRESNSTINGGNGRALTIKAGASDNTAGRVGGNLILNPGSPVSPAVTFGNVLMATAGGNVGIGTAGPGSKLEINLAGTEGSGLNVLSGASNKYALIQWGRTSAEGVLAISRSAGAFFADSVPGDAWFGSTNGTIAFGDQTAGTASLIVKSGNVGIGTTSPAEKLHVAGSIKVDGNINAKYQDLAEWVPSSEELAAGTVVVLDSTKSNQVISSTQSYDTRVAGVISAQPGITLGESGEGKVLVATTGRVRVKVDASRGPIQIGDLLVTSDIPGLAMKSEAVNLGGVQIHRPGTIIGKALEPLAKGTGEILVLLSLQ